MKRAPKATDPSDEEIVELLWKRSETGIQCVAQKYGKLCYGLAMNLLGQREDAEECVNDVYMAVWNTIPPNSPSSLTAYVGRITRNIAINYIRRRESQRRKCGGTVLLEELAECLPDSDSFVTADDLHLKDALNDFFSLLTEEERSIFLRRYYDGETAECIAKSLGLRAGTVRVRLHRLRERLREHLIAQGISL